MNRLLVIACMLASSRAFADDVSPEVQAKAEALLAEGNELFAQRAHEAALEKFQQALALWDHPLLHFNIAVTEVRLDRFLEAADELDAALRFDATRFPAELYQQALDYQKLVAGRVGYLEATCKQTGTHVSLDGKPWLACKGEQRQRVLAGEHVIVAEAPGMLTVSRRVVVVGNATARETIELMPLASAVKLEYPTARWLPWTVTAGGAALLLAGGAVWLAGRSQMDDFDKEVARECPCEADLSAHPSLTAMRDSAHLKGYIGDTMMIGGVAVAIGGATWAITNRPRRIAPTVEIAPTVGGARAGIGWSF
jgi:hypothetical protein